MIERGRNAGEQEKEVLIENAPHRAIKQIKINLMEEVEKKISKGYSVPYQKR